MEGLFMTLNLVPSTHNFHRVTLRRPHEFEHHIAARRKSLSKKLFFFFLPFHLRFDITCLFLRKYWLPPIFHPGGRRVEILWSKPFFFFLFIKQQTPSIFRWRLNLVEARQSLTGDTQVARYNPLPWQSGRSITGTNRHSLHVKYVKLSSLAKRMYTLIYTFLHNSSVLKVQCVILVNV